ncbi:MAG: hypothetical protein IJH62_02915, partial [Mogibacterium sp.]|nr:hypothetical protein [Mogibacterium sp.]
VFNFIELHKQEIETAVGEPLDWTQKEGIRIPPFLILGVFYIANYHPQQLCYSVLHSLLSENKMNFKN